MVRATLTGWLAAALCATVLAGCGGGSDGTDPGPGDVPGDGTADLVDSCQVAPNPAEQPGCSDELCASGTACDPSVPKRCVPSACTFVEATCDWNCLTDCRNSPGACIAIPGDVLHDAVDAPDATPDVPDATPDVPATCDTAGAKECTADGYSLRTCTDGLWVESPCMRGQGKLCADGACVDPWTTYPAASLPTCPDVEGGTAETLAEKAAHYDELAARLHVSPGLKWMMSVTLAEEVLPCLVPPCPTAPVPLETATWQDVVRWHSGENDGLWSALYLTSQAFRYGATKSPEALDMIRLLLEGEVTRMRITGVPGVFTRQFIPPDVPGLTCPDPVAQKAAYTTDEEKDDNRWVQVRDDGCVWVVDRLTGEWTNTPAGVATPHCGLEDFKGWCWLDNVSQDEYAGHMLALGVLWKLVDDPGVRATVKDLLTQVAQHLADNDLYFIDWDGRQTEHGKLHIYSFADSPGFLSSMSMAYILMGAEASGDPALRAYYDRCLLQRGGQCEGWPYPEEPPYDEALPQMWLYLGEEGCKSNYNNFSMVYTSLHNLVWFETDPVIREEVQAAFDLNFMREAGQVRALIQQRNPWFNFGWAALKRLGPGSDGPDLGALDDAICSLKQFPAGKVQVAADSAGKYPHYCDQRNDGSAAEFIVPLQERCVATFEWWADPYDRETCGDSPATVVMPADYLLPYWMGRYFGFLPETL